MTVGVSLIVRGFGYGGVTGSLLILLSGMDGIDSVVWQTVPAVGESSEQKAVSGSITEDKWANG